MNIVKLLHPAISIILIVLSTSSFSDTYNTAMKAKIQGEWLSPKWNYGFRIEGMSGYVTQWNYKYNPNDKTVEGDKVLTIDKITATGFLAKQQFFNGSLVSIVGTLVDANTIKLEAGPEVWLMVRPK